MLDEAFGRAGCLVVPELFELLLELPGAIDAMVVLVEGPEAASVALCACR